MTFCPRCGKWFEANFCPNCGIDLRPATRARLPGSIGRGILAGSALSVLVVWIPYLGWMLALIPGMVAGLIARGAGRGALAGFLAGIVGWMVTALFMIRAAFTTYEGVVWILYALVFAPLASLFGGLIGGASRPRTPKSSTEAERTTGPEPSGRPAREVRTPRECRMCHNINPPYAVNYCIKCGSRLD